MNTNVLIVSDLSLDNLLPHITQHRDWQLSYCKPFQLIENTELYNIKAICIVLPNQGIEQALCSIKNLRLKHKFCGAIIVLSFLSKEYLLKQKGREIFTSKGCFYLQLPFLMENLVELLVNPIKLSEEQMITVCQQLSAQPVFEMASKLRHDWDNKFSLILGHLLQLEKFSYFTSPDLNKILKEVNRIDMLLTSQKIDEVSLNFDKLIKLLITWKPNVNPYQEVFNNGLSTIKAWIELVNKLKLNSNDKLLMDEVFRLAKLLQTNIKQMLETLTAIKQEVGKV